MQLEAPGRTAWGLAFSILMVAPLLAAAPLAGPVDALVGSGQPFVSFTTVASGLSSPLFAVHAGDASGRLFIGQQPGTVRVLAGGALQPGTWLDVTSKVLFGGERGLLGLAFHPDFEANGLFFVSYTRKPDGALVVERYTVPSPPLGAPSPTSGSVVLTIPHPTYGNHNGGNIAFGPDGYLYWGTGDGGGAGDPFENAENVNALLGKMLRLDVDVPSGYAIPPGNPFVGIAGRDEVWAYGLRNPWRWSFDRTTGDLWIGDVGQNMWEEVDLQVASAGGGQNYGWDNWEGNHPHEGIPDATGKTFPVMEYNHDGVVHCSVTGGYLYRGTAIPLLLGSYVFGDYCSGVIWMARGLGQTWLMVQIADTAFGITSFGEDEAGELYVVYQSGTVSRIGPP